MVSMAVFDGDAFTQASMIRGLDKRPYIPQMLDQLIGFEPRRVSTDTVFIEVKTNTNGLIAVTLRGAPIEMGGKRPKNIRPLLIPRVAKGNTLFAHELANLAAPDGQTDDDVVATRIAEMQEDLITDLELTEEHMRLGALRGVIYDADGATEIINFFDEFGVSAPGAVDLTLDDANMTIGTLIEKIGTLIVLPMARASGAGNNPRFRIRALAGDTFWYKLVGHPAIKETYLNQAAAATLRQDKAWESYEIGGIEFVHYRGTDDTSTIAINTSQAVVFPVGVPGMFQHVMGPANEFLDLLNQPGRRYVPFLVRDVQRNQWVQPEIYAYPLFVNSRPDLVMTATV